MRRIFTAVGCVLALSMGGTCARAATGSIGFSGAVVEPTCAVVDTDGSPGFQRSGNQPELQTCGRTEGDAGITYARSVIQLDADATAHDRLLSYYAGYAGTGTVRLVVRTYQ